METHANKDLYEDLAARCYRTLQELCSDLPADTAAKLPEAVLAFWKRLAWADFMLAKGERKIFNLIFPGKDSEAMTNDEEQRPLEEFLQEVADYDAVTEEKVGRRIESQLEAFGYALLSVDREFSDRELEVLSDTLKWTRSILYPEGPSQ